MSEWWREQIGRFVRSGCRRWVIRVGRRGGKSSALARLAVAVWLFGSWDVPRGDIAVIPFISVSKDEAGARLRTIGEILRVLDIRCEERGEEIEVTAPRPLIFRAIACTTRASVGFTSVFIVADEQALWESRESMANPAPEVMGHLTPTAATQRHAWIVESSAPHGVDDHHAQAFDRGDTEQQRVSFAPTWVANPTLTEADTHALEPDPRLWSMRYAAVPGATVSAALEPDDIAACFEHVTLPTPAMLMQFGTPFCAIDASSLRGDAFAWVSGYCTPQLLIATEVDAVEGAELRNVTMEQVLERVAASAHRVGAYRVVGDQREAAGIASLLAKRNLTFREYTWSESSKDESIMLLRRLARERRIALPDGQLRSELTAMRARLLPSGKIRYDHAGDRASALITAAHAIVAGDIHMDGPITGLGLSDADGDHEERMRIARAGRFNQRDLPDHLIERRRGGSVFDVSPRGSWK